LSQISNTPALREAFDINPGEIISLIGAGGKTSLLYALARELTQQGKLVITTTTTKIFPPSRSDSPCLFISSKREDLEAFILGEGKGFGHITLASGRSKKDHKLLGLEPDLISCLSGLGPVTYTIVEADGAAGRSLKAPDIRFEPVIPSSTTLLVPLIGIDILGRPFSEEYVFRSQIGLILTHTKPGEPVTYDMIVDLMTHKNGILHAHPNRVKIIPFINKADLDKGLEKSRILARKILNALYPKINRVVIGQAKKNPPLLEVFSLCQND